MIYYYYIIVIFYSKLMAIETELLILNAATLLLEQGGPAAVTTRNVCDAAGVKAPTLYHYFGDKNGLTAALIKQGVTEFMTQKYKPLETDDLLSQLRHGWDIAVDFALLRPHLSALLQEQAKTKPELLADSYNLMRGIVQRLVDSNRFKRSVNESSRAIWAASNGVIFLVTSGKLSAEEIKSTSELMFFAVTTELTKKKQS